MRSRRLLTGTLAAALVAVGAAAAATTLATAAQGATPPGLHVSGTRLLERDGTPFVARGVSHAHTWYTAQTPTTIPAIRAAGANALRVVLSGGDRWTRNDTADVAEVVRLCKANELICMLENHDTTGYGEQSGAVTLDVAADYWVSVKDALVGQEDHVQINIGNEPYGNDATVNARWAADSVAAIRTLRAAGLHHNIVVDAPSWGQDWAGIMRENAETVAAGDPDGNVLFSVHMYGVYAQASTIRAYLDAFEAKGLPLVIGEFGIDHSDGDPDEDTIMAEAVARGIGYYGWSWSGNSGGVEYLDMVEGFDPTRRTPWGERIFDGPDGIAATAVTASVYRDPAEEPTEGPTDEPTADPTDEPTGEPTEDPTDEPTTAPGTCTATFTVVGSWPGGFQGSVRVTAGSAPVSGWTTAFTLPGGATVAQGWGGTFSGTSTVSVSNAAWNGSLGAGQSAEYGFIGSGAAPTTAPTVTCA